MTEKTFTPLLMKKEINEKDYVSLVKDTILDDTLLQALETVNLFGPLIQVLVEFCEVAKYLKDEMQLQEIPYFNTEKWKDGITKIVSDIFSHIDTAKLIDLVDPQQPCTTLAQAIRMQAPIYFQADVYKAINENIKHIVSLIDECCEKDKTESLMGLSFGCLMGAITTCSYASIKKNTLPILHSITPQYHTMLNNALMTKMQQTEAINAGAFDFTAINKKEKQDEITAYAIIEFDEEKAGWLLTKHHFTETERKITDAIVTLWMQAQEQGTKAVITPDMVYRNIPGCGAKASPQQKEEIIKTINFFRRLHIYVDATDEIRAHKVRDKNGNLVQSCRFDDYYLTATRAQYSTENGGKVVDAYLINGEPLMLTYAKMTNQLITVDKKYLAVKKVKRGKVSTEPIKMSDGRSSMVSYMLRRIAIMKRDKKNKTHKQSDIILFDSLFRNTEQTSDNRIINRRNRDFCFDVLDYWKATGYITDYKKQLKGRSITGIIIIL